MLSPSPARFELRIIGHPGLYTSEGELVRFKTQKTLALLIVLAMDKRPLRQWRHPRAHLADLLWGDFTETEGRKSLSTALWRLRKVFGAGAFTEHDDQMSLGPGVLHVDIDALGNMDSEVTVDAILDGFSIRGTPEFEHWLDRIRAEWMPRLLRRGMLEIQKARLAGDLPRLADLGSRLLRVSEYSEDAILARVEALKGMGSPAEALRDFMVWGLRLHEELGRGPSAEISETIESLMRWSPTPRVA